jgi:hypothetical protein
MQFTRRTLFSDDILPNDELDDLFNQLEQLEPPPALIARILSTISHLPRPRPPQAEQYPPWDELDTLVVRHEDYPPS